MNLSILLEKMCVIQWVLDIYIYMYIYIYVCLCVCVYLYVYACIMYVYSCNYVLNKLNVLLIVTIEVFAKILIRCLFQFLCIRFNSLETACPTVKKLSC
jgi:hypothetical protein